MKSTARERITIGFRILSVIVSSTRGLKIVACAASIQSCLMDDPQFNEPRLALNRIYTRLGDKGDTSLVGGQRVAKDALRIESYGTVDELNAFVGLAGVT